jgi:hypothetical protein
MRCEVDGTGPGLCPDCLWYKECWSFEFCYWSVLSLPLPSAEINTASTGMKDYYEMGYVGDGNWGTTPTTTWRTQGITKKKHQ